MKPGDKTDQTDFEGHARLNALLMTMPSGAPLLHSAADEIERLREELALFKRIAFEKQQKIIAVGSALDA